MKIPTTAPTITIGDNSAWQIDLAAVRAQAPKHRDSTVAAHILHLPRACPMWCCYAMITLHLRVETGLEAPIIRLPGATHEVTIVALHPDYIPDVLNPMRHYLRPVNFVGQWQVNARPNPVDLDKLAILKHAHVVKMLLLDQLSPEHSGGKHSAWCQLYSASHIRE